MSLQEKLDAFRTKFETEVAPPEVVALMHRVTAQLIASGQVDRALKAGDRAPVLTLPDADGNAISSGDLTEKGPLILTFYRGMWCPYCNIDLEAIEEARPQIEARGATLTAISPQTEVNSRKTRQTLHLGFPILRDQGGALAAAFGIRWALPDDLKQTYLKLGVNLELFNDDDSWTLPMPARYVIGRDGIISYAEINPDYTRRPEPSDVLPVIDQMQRSDAA